MAIKNYTTKVDAYTSIGEIQGALARHGATKIMIDYDNGKPQAIAFGIDTPAGPRGFRLPAAVDGTLRAFANQKIKADREQAEMTAWRNVRDWVLAQMALIESCDVPMQQIFLPYMADDRGRTVYELYAASMGSSASTGRSTVARETARFAGRWPCGTPSANTASRCVPCGRASTWHFCAGTERHC